MRFALVVSLGLTTLRVISSPTQAQSLGEGVDQEALDWHTSGAATWAGQTVYSHDGIDSAESGPIRGGQASLLETVVTGPGGIGFWWNVSSWPHLDFLRFYIDGTEQASLTGSPGWQQTGFSVPPGEHVLRWLYTKSTPGPGLDRGWVDEVVFTQAPILFTQPLSQSAQPGQTVTFSVFAIGASLTYQWFLEEVAQVGATNAQLVLTNVQRAQAGTYSVIVSNAYGSALSAPATLVVIAFPEALETTNLVWTSRGDKLWSTQTAVTHDGLDAAESGGPLFSPSDDQYSFLEAQTPSAGIVSFYLKVSTLQGWDSLIFQIGSEELMRVTGEVEWNLFSFPVTDRQPLIWTYYKRTQPPGGANRAWLDEVNFTPVFAPLIHQHPLSGIYPADSLVELPLRAIGAEPLTYQWYFNSAPLPAGTNALLAFPNVQTNQSGSYFAIVSNAYGMATSVVAVLTIHALGGALDTTGLIWSTNGDAGWVSQSSVTHDGVDAAASESIGHQQAAALETVLQGPGTLAFWWKVSSEPDFDLLMFYGSWADDGSGQPLLQISGETGWERRSVIVPPGDQLVRWTYAKDATESAGFDEGWIDEVTFDPLTAPIVLDQPQSQLVPVGRDASLWVTAYGAEPLTYQWQHNGTALLDETNVTLTLSAVQPAQTGEYRVIISNEFGNVTSAVARLDLISWAEALDNSLSWSNALADPDPLSGVYVWSVDAATSHDGADAVTLGPLVGGGAILETTVTGPGSVSFWWKVSSHDCCEFFSFRIDNNLEAQIRGNVDWEYRTVAVPAGVRTLRWEYSDFVEGIPWNNDRAWLDQVTFISGHGLPSVLIAPRQRTVWAGSDAPLSASAAGALPLAHQWLINELPILDATNAVLPLADVQLTQAGSYRAVVTNSFGAVTSAPSRLTVIAPQVYGRFTTSGDGEDVEVVGRFAYLVDGPAGLSVFDVSDPTNAVLVGSYDTPGYALGVRVSGPLAYVADGEAGVQILDISVPSNIVPIGHYDTKGMARGGQLVGTRLFLADGPGGMLVLDVHDPAHPARLGGYRPLGDVFRVQVAGSVAYVASYGSGLHIFDVSNPAAIVPVGFFEASDAIELQAVGTRLYLGEADARREQARVHVLDISSPARPTRLGSIVSAARGGSIRMQAVGDLLFVTIDDQGLELLDVSDPTRLISRGSILRGGFLGGLQIIGRRAFLAGVEHDLTLLELNGLPTQPVLRSPRMSGGRFEAAVENLAAPATVVLEVSMNLTQWRPLQTNVVNGSSLPFSLPVGNDGSTAFFRAVVK